MLHHGALLLRTNDLETRDFRSLGALDKRTSHITCVFFKISPYSQADLSRFKFDRDIEMTPRKLGITVLPTRYGTREIRDRALEQVVAAAVDGKADE
jgi:hypothetical protein